MRLVLEQRVRVHIMFGAREPDEETGGGDRKQRFHTEREALFGVTIVN